MKKLGILLATVLIAVLWSCDTQDGNKMESDASNKVNAKTLGEFYHNYGVQQNFTNFDANSQTEITLPKGTILNIPYGAFTDGTSTYFGIVKIVSKEFTKVSDMAMSNFQTVDNNGKMLATGGSIEMIFLDAKNKKLFLNNGKNIGMKYPAKIESSLKNSMNVYDGDFLLGSNQNDQLIWTLKQSENVNLVNNYYNYTLTPLAYNGSDAILQRVPCESYLRSNPPNWVAYDRCMGIIRRNWDIRFWDRDAVPFDVKLLGEFNPDFTRIMVFPGNQPSVTNLLFDSQNNRFTTASTNIENVGAITIAAFSIENGEFKYNIMSSDTGINSITLDLHSGSVEEYNNELSALID